MSPSMCMHAAAKTEGCSKGTAPEGQRGSRHHGRHCFHCAHPSWCAVYSFVHAPGRHAYVQRIPMQEPPKRSGAANVFSSVIQKLEQQYVVRLMSYMVLVWVASP